MPKTNTGGKQPGSGHPTGGKSMADLTALIPVVATSNELYEFVGDYNLKPLQVEAITLASRGWDNRAIAKAIGVHYQTIGNWKKEEWWLPSVKYAQELFHRESRRVFDPMIVPAIRVYEDVLGQRKELGLALGAATAVFDRSFGKPRIMEVTAERKVTRRMKIVSRRTTPEGDEQTIEGEIKVSDSSDSGNGEGDDGD